MNKGANHRGGIPPLSKECVYRLRRARKQGYSYELIAEKYGCSLSSVKRYTSDINVKTRYGLKLRNSKYNAVHIVDEGKIEALWRTGRWSVSDIGYDMGEDEETVKAVLIKKGYAL